MKHNVIRRLTMAGSLAAMLSMIASAQQPAPVREMLVGMEVSVAADGKVLAVEPDANLPESIRTLARNRVLQWRYMPAMWQGKPVATQSYLVVRVVPVPTTSGGFALRIVGTGGRGDLNTGFSIEVAKYPSEAQKKGKGGIFVYVVDVDAQGRAQQARLVEPQEATLDKYGKMMAKSGLTSSESARFRPFNADGQAVACEWVFPIIFGVGDSVPRHTQEETARIQAFKAQLPRACPVAYLETKIENTLL